MTIEQLGAERAETVTCPTCLEHMPAHRLCNHDDPDTGPICDDVCCERWHAPTSPTRGPESGCGDE